MSSFTGLGYDSHRLLAGRRLVLGGVQIDHSRGLDGHSDADVLTHAIIDALLGAAGLGDIGTHFPDSDERYRDADSLILLAAVVTNVTSAGFDLLNVDATVIMEQPKLKPYAGTISERLSAVLGIPAQRVNIKASTGEGMGFIGREEGVAAIAVATLRTR